MTDNIIQQMCEKMQELDLNFFKEGIGKKDFSTLTKEYGDKGMQILCKHLSDMMEKLDEGIKNCAERKSKWVVDGIVKKKVLIPIGEISYRKTRYKNVETGEYSCLIDDCLDIDKHMRMTDAVKVRILDEAIDTTYKKGGEQASYTIQTSKETTKNIIESIDEKKLVVKKPEELREVEYLYIDADEAHIKIQHNEKTKQVICKEAYVYEGKELEAPRSKRTRLKNKWTFAGIYQKSAENTRFWEEIRDYIDSHYDVDKIKKIYLNADGGAWIKEGLNMFDKMEFVFDGFHLMQYINRLTSHMKDSREEAKAELYKVLRAGNEEEVASVIARIENANTDKSKAKTIKESAKFIQNNIEGIRRRLNVEGTGIVGCSAEGHISHDIASRMTTLARGWSIENANKMAKLRVYKINGGKVREIIYADRERKVVGKNLKAYKELKKETSKKIKESYKKANKEALIYFDLLQATIDTEARCRYNLNF